MATTVTKTIKSSGGDYSSRSAFEAAQQGNLVTADEIRVGECYGFTDTTVFSVDGSTTDATRFMRFSAASGAEAQMPLDTGGTANLHQTNATGAAITVADNYVQFWDQQFQTIYKSGTSHCVQVSNAGNAVEVQFLRCVFSGDSDTSGSNIHYGIVHLNQSNVYCINCFGVNMSTAQTTSPPFYVNVASANLFCYNCTAIGAGAGRGFWCASGTMTGKNCLADNNTTDFVNSGTFTGNNNASGDGTALGTSPRTSQTFTFASGTDFHLASGDTGALDYGADLSGDGSFPFSDDFDGVTRSGTWDIGADEYVAGGGGDPEGSLIHGKLINGGLLINGVLN